VTDKVSPSMSKIFNKDVGSLAAKHSQNKNLDGCEEDVFDFVLYGIEGNEESREKTGLFNNTLQKMGGFQVFDTPEKTIYFYAKKAEDGTCKRYMKIKDKKTGREIVKEIKDIKKTDKGFVISTSDGRNHTLNFSSENGIPYLTLDGKKMLLNYATGKGGTFWYNPEDGSWNAINGQIIPFDDEFKKGEVVKVKDGKVMGVPGKNPVEKRITGSRKSFSLSLPGITPKDIILIGFLFVVVAFFYLFRVAT